MEKDVVPEGPPPKPTAPEVPAAKWAQAAQSVREITDEVVRKEAADKASQRGMTIHQWLALKYLAEQGGKDEAWIDENFFAEDGELYTSGENGFGMPKDYPMPRDLEVRMALSRIRGAETRNKK